MEEGSCVSPLVVSHHNNRAKIITYERRKEGTTEATECVFFRAEGTIEGYTFLVGSVGKKATKGAMREMAGNPCIP